jgi:hypothetical protein
MRIPLAWSITARLVHASDTRGSRVDEEADVAGTPFERELVVA